MSAPPQCDLCEDAPATVRCADCGMNLCSEGGCDADMHSDGKTKFHKRVPIGESLADAAAKQAAAQQLQAAKAAEEAAKADAMAAALSAPGATAVPQPGGDAAAGDAPVVMCEMCESEPVAAVCPSCNTKLCSGCDADMHSTGQMKTHLRKPVHQKLPPKPEPAPEPAAPAPEPVAADEAPAWGPGKGLQVSLMSIPETPSPIHSNPNSSGNAHANAVPVHHTPSPAPTAAAPTPAPAAVAVDPHASTAMCDLCDSEPQAIACRECKMSLCAGCNEDMHQGASVSKHTRYPLGAAPPPTPSSLATPLQSPGPAGPALGGMGGMRALAMSMRAPSLLASPQPSISGPGGSSLGAVPPPSFLLASPSPMVTAMHASHSNNPGRASASATPAPLALAPSPDPAEAAPAAAVAAAAAPAAASAAAPAAAAPAAPAVAAEPQPQQPPLPPGAGAGAAPYPYPYAYPYPPPPPQQQPGFGYPPMLPPYQIGRAHV